MLYSCTYMKAVGVEGLSFGTPNGNPHWHWHVGYHS